MALLFGHYATAASGILGVLRAGRVYCALDPTIPMARNRALLDSLGCQAILTDSRHRDMAASIAGRRGAVLSIDEIEDSLAASLPEMELAPDTPAGVYVTSGSTGQPKQVLRTHGDLLRRVQLDVHTLQWQPEDAFSFLYGTSNAGSLPDLFGSLLTGATLHFFDVRQAGLEPMAAWLQQSCISILHLNSTLLRMFLDQLPPGAYFPCLRQVRPSQRLFTADVQRLWPVLPADAVVVHQYASTEAGPAVSLVMDRHTVPSGDVVPVGRPLPGVEIMIVDGQGRPAGPETVGELLIRSPYLASRGYWQTATPADGQADGFFATGDLGRMRSDGLLELTGRDDALVKIRGFQVSLAAIEAALVQLDLVGEAAVLVQPDRHGDRVPIAYVVPSAEAEDLAEELRRRLAELLPSYAVPTRFVFLASLPRLGNGKVDHRALPAAGSARPALAVPYAAPRTPFEEHLAAIWAEVLGIDLVGVHDHFLDLGGHSLLAARIVGRVIHSLGLDLSPQVLLQTPTVAEMAEVLVAQAAQAMGEADLEALLRETEEAG